MNVAFGEGTCADQSHSRPRARILKPLMDKLSAVLLPKYTHNESFKLTPEQMQAQGNPLASSAKERPYIRVVAMLAMMVLPFLGACVPPPNQANCQGSFRIGESEAQMKAD